MVPIRKRFNLYITHFRPFLYLLCIRVWTVSNSFISNTLTLSKAKSDQISIAWRQNTIDAGTQCIMKDRKRSTLLCIVTTSPFGFECFATKDESIQNACRRSYSTHNSFFPRYFNNGQTSNLGTTDGTQGIRQDVEMPIWSRFLIWSWWW